MDDALAIQAMWYMLAILVFGLMVFIIEYPVHFMFRDLDRREKELWAEFDYQQQHRHCLPCPYKREDQ